KNARKMQKIDTSFAPLVAYTRVAPKYVYSVAQPAFHSRTAEQQKRKECEERRNPNLCDMPPPLLSSSHFTDAEARTSASAST
ncbi:hypothetical protein COCMIDRAFT_99001, partial [Bipolaris oryzae ATCC 44560]